MMRQGHTFQTRLAQVLLVERSSPVAVPDRAVAGKIIYDERPRLWGEIERIVGYRVTDENFERALMEANARRMDRAYDTLMAKRRPAPQVLVRPGIAQVLGVR